MIHRLSSASGYESLLPRRTQTFWRVVGEGLTLRERDSERLLFAYHPELQLSQIRPDLLASAGVGHVVALPLDPLTNWYRLPDGEVIFREPGYYNSENQYDTGRPRERNSGLVEKYGALDPAWEGDPSAIPPDGLELRYDGDDGRVFSVAGPVPRAYVVAGCEEVDQPLEALERFVERGASSSRAVILERPFLRRAGFTCAGSPPSGPRPASVIQESTDSLRVEVRALRAGVVNDSWDDDWSAIVDGKDAEVLPANYASRAIRLPAGTHTVHFAYEPVSFRVGAALSAGSLAIVAVALAFFLWRGRDRSRISRR